MLSLSCDLDDPSGELGPQDLDIELGCTGAKEVVFDVLHPGLDLPFLLRRSRWRRVDLEAMVSGQLAVASVEDRGTVDTEGCTDHSRLEVVGHDDLGHPAELLEGLDVQAHPRLDLLVEDDADDHVPRVGQDHHEDPRSAQPALRGLPELPDVAEVDLRHLAGRGLDRDGDVLGLDALCLSNPRAQPLDRREASRELFMLEPKSIEDGLRRRAMLEHRRHLADPRCDTRFLLGWSLRDRSPDSCFQSLELGQLLRLALQEAGLAEQAAISKLGLRAHAE